MLGSSRGVFRALGLVVLFLGGLTFAGIATGGLPPLFVSKSHSPEPVTVDDQVTFTVGVRNGSTDTLEFVTVTDTLPFAFDFDGSDPAACAIPTYRTLGSSGQLIYCDADTLTPGASATFEIFATPRETGTFTNFADATGDTCGDGCIVGSNTAADVVTVVAGPPPLVVSKSHTPEPATVNEPVTFSVSVTNTDEQSYFVTVYDDLPPGFVYDDGASDPRCFVPDFRLLGDGFFADVRCDAEFLSGGETETFTIVATPTSTGTFTNAARAEGQTKGPSVGSNTAEDLVTVVPPTPPADISVTKSDSPDPVTAGDGLTYSISVANAAGTMPALGVTLVDTLPAGVTFGSATAGQGTCVQSGQTVSCELGTIAPGGSVPVTIAVTPTAAGTIVNTATVSTSSPETNTSNNSDSESTTVNAAASPPPPAPPALAPADVSVTVGQAPDPIGIGDVLTYTITVTNNGPSVATGVGVLSETPDGVATFVSGSTTQGSCIGDINLACTIGTLQPGESAIVMHRVRLSRLGQSLSVVTVQGDQPDPNPGNNRRLRSISVLTETPQQDPVVGPPVFGRTANVAIVSGRIRYRPPTGGPFIEITDLTQIPIGSQIDTRFGRIELTVALPDGTLQTTQFFEGLSTLLQPLSAASRRKVAGRAQATAVTELRLTGGNFPACRRILRRAARTTASADQARRPVGKVRRLWGSGRGSFRTRGRYASATVRGTIWLTEDYCNGTLVRVTEGSVTIRDLVRNRTVIVNAGQSYFAATR